MSDLTPVILFTYARPDYLARVLACLKENKVPLLWVFSDGAKGTGDRARVEAVRQMLKRVDWTEIRITERPANLGLGRNVRSGVNEVVEEFSQFVVWEDDLIAVPGTYTWVVAALNHYRDDPKVMSVSAWTHPRITPNNGGGQPYFDARADCWVWGSYARSWRGMNDETALDKMAALESTGESANFYGSDLPVQARDELRKNTWAVRWLYHHFKHGGLCLRPPESMVEHIGFDEATNASDPTEWMNPKLDDAPVLPVVWPDVVEHAACQRLWQTVYPPPGWLGQVRRVLGAVVMHLTGRA